MKTSTKPGVDGILARLRAMKGKKKPSGNRSISDIIAELQDKKGEYPDHAKEIDKAIAALEKCEGEESGESADESEE